MNGNYSTTTIIIIIIVAIFIGWLICRSLCKSTVYKYPAVAPMAVVPIPQTVEGMNTTHSPAPSTPSNSPNILYNFYSPQCPHCKKFAPSWEEVANRLKNKDGLAVVAINVTDPNNENIVFYYNITQLPTVILATPDKNIEYTGDRSVKDLHDFVLGHLGN